MVAEAQTLKAPPPYRWVKPPRPIRLLKPRGFRPAAQVTRGEFRVDGPSFTNSVPRARGAKRRGKKYEQKALAALEALGFQLFVPSPWLEFDARGGASRLCQPDALAFGDDWLLIFEIKLSHTIMAYWQLRELYAPVLKHMYPGHQIRVCEVTRSFDPATPWPEDIMLLQDFSALRALRTEDFGVLQWRS